METMLAPLLASPIASAVITILAVLVALKVAWYSLKKVVMNVIMGGIVFLFATQILGIHMDIGFWVWGLTILFGPIPMAIAAIWAWL